MKDDPDLAPLWGATASHQLPPRVSSGSSSPDEKAQGVKPGGGDKTKTDKKKKNEGKKDKGKKDKGKKRKKDDDDDDAPDQEHDPLPDGDDDDDHEEDFGLDGLSEILKEEGKKGNKSKPGTTKKPATREPMKRPSSKKGHEDQEAFQLNSMYPALMFVVRLKWGTFYSYLMHIM